MNGRAARPPRKIPEAVLQARYRQALALHGQGDHARAEALYRDILGHMPESFHALHMLGVLLAQRSDWQASAALIERAIGIDPTVAAAHANLGNTLREQGRKDEALACYERALRLDPDHVRALKGRGLLLWQRGEREAALACYEHLLGLEPDYADGWIMKAAVYDHLGRSDEAIAAYRKALAFANVTHPDKIRYLLAALGDGQVPTASPVEYVRDLFDRYAGHFDAHLVGTLRYRGPEVLIERLREHLPAGPLNGLDIGCGTGLCGPLLKPFCRTLTGLDVSPKMLDEAARREVYDELVPAEIGTWLATQRGRFDLVVAADVFIYIGDLAPVIGAAHGATRPNAVFVFTTEVCDGVDSRLLKSLRYAHSASYLERIAAAAGWRVASLTQHELREENGRGVAQHLVVLRRPPAS